MKKQLPWDNYRHVIRSYNGGWKVGEAVYCHGYSIMDDLVGNISYMQMHILNATGKLPERRIADWFEARQICMSWPDPRIWCNHIGALAGTLRTSPVAATTAGILASDSRAYGGPKTIIEGMQFIQQALQEYQNGSPVENIVEKACRKNGGKPTIMGYARPIAKGDERIAAMERIRNKLGFDIGPHLSLAKQIERELLEQFDESMNINGYVSAFLSDQGFSGLDVSRISATLVSSGVTACYIDTMQRPASSFSVLQCKDVVYEGCKARNVIQTD